MFNRLNRVNIHHEIHWIKRFIGNEIWPITVNRTEKVTHRNLAKRTMKLFGDNLFCVFLWNFNTSLIFHSLRWIFRSPVNISSISGKLYNFLVYQTAGTYFDRRIFKTRFDSCKKKICLSSEQTRKSWRTFSHVAMKSCFFFFSGKGQGGEKRSYPFLRRREFSASVSGSEIYGPRSRIYFHVTQHFVYTDENSTHSKMNISRASVFYPKGTHTHHVCENEKGGRKILRSAILSLSVYRYACIFDGISEQK